MDKEFSKGNEEKMNIEAQKWRISLGRDKGRLQIRTQDYSWLL